MTQELKTYEDWLCLLALANAGDNIAQYEVAVQYDFGLAITTTEIVPENKPMAYTWYSKAYENGNVDAIIRVADFLSEGIYCNQNIELAIELYQKRIDSGDGLAAHNLAIVYRDRRDYEKAFELHKIA